jgi:hypothetical protein
VCQPITIVATSASGVALSVDANNVYFALGASLYSCPLTGGCGTGHLLSTLPGVTAGVSDTIADVSLVAAPVSSAYGANLYALYYADDAADDEQVKYAVFAKSTGTLTAQYVLTSGVGGSTVGAMALDATNGWVYYLVSPQPYKMKPDTTQPSTLLPFTASANLTSSNWAPTADGSGNVYFAFLAGMDKGVYYCGSGTCPTPAGNAELPAMTNPQGTYWDGAHIWAADAAGTLYKCPAATSCSATTGAFATSLTAPTSVVADAAYVYWSSPSAGQILRCPVSGCGGTPSPYVTGVFGINGTTASPLLQDSVAVYWADNTGIRRVAK